MKIFSSYIYLLIFSSCMGANLFASSPMPQPALQAMIESFVKQQVKHAPDETVNVTLTQFDPQHLAPCLSQIELGLASVDVLNQPTALSVSCPNPGGWRVFVPIELQIMTPVITLNSALFPGETVTQEMLKFSTLDRTRLYEGYFKEQAEVLGLAATRMIPEGAVLTKKNLRQVPLIKRNQSVSLVLKQGAIEIEMLGIAKADAYLNDVVKVLNPSSKKIIDARVIDKDRAEILF